MPNFSQIGEMKWPVKVRILGTITLKFFSDSSKAVITSKQQGLSEPASKPVQVPSIPPLKINTGQTRGAERKAVLLPPSSFTLPSRTKRSPLQHPLPEEVELRASTSTHPASTPRTSIESEKQAASSPSSATSSPNKGSEDENKGEQNSAGEFSEEEDRNEGEWDVEREGDRSKLDTREEAAKSGLFGQLKKEGNLQERVAHMKNILQEFHDMKVAYR